MLAERLKYLRISNNMTLEEVGKIIGVQKSAVKKYENGTVKNIPIPSIEKLAHHFNVSPSYLMGWDNEESIIYEIDKVKLFEKYVELLDFKIEPIFTSTDEYDPNLELYKITNKKGETFSISYSEYLILIDRLDNNFKYELEHIRKNGFYQS